MSAPTKRSRSSSRTTDVVLVTAGDPARRTGGNIYAEHMTEALRAAGLKVRVQILDRVTTFHDVREPLAVVDTIAGRYAVTGLETLRGSGTRVVLMALMSRGALALAMHSDRVVTPSDTLHDELTKAGVPPPRVAVIPPGQDPVKPARAGDASRVVLCVANWTPDKGIDVLVRAVAALPQLSLDLVGDAPDRAYAAKVRSLLADGALRGRVRVWGSLGGSRLEARYHRASIFALPSRNESYGMALATALAHGLPSIGCDIPATREVAGGAALLIRNRRVSELIGALNSLATDADLRTRLSRAALERARTYPSWAASERRFVDVVREELARR